MCIVLLATSHPDYAVIIIDNRDEFILRPTSRPHWWRHRNGKTSILSSRDLQRAERGTWMGITRDGLFAVLTNYRQVDLNDVSHPIYGARSRGVITSIWLGSDPNQTAAEIVHNTVTDSGGQGAGGFSMLCGKLRLRNKDGERNIEPLAIISNQSDHVDRVPWIGGSRGEVHGLSNTQYDVQRPWPKISQGCNLLQEAIQDAVSANLSEDELIAKLFDILDTNSLKNGADMTLSEYIQEQKTSIFVPALGDMPHRQAMEEARAKGKAPWITDDYPKVPPPDPNAMRDCHYAGFETGMTGTQRQTVLLVDWDGNVTYQERALWDGNGNPVRRGEGDMTFKFKIEGWEDGN